MGQRRFDMNGGGSLVLREDGGLVWLEARREEDGRGLYKVWLRGELGGRLLLGTLAPEGGSLRLFRRLSRDRLAREGCGPVTGAECALAFPFEGGWRRECCPRVGDPIVARSLEGRQMLVRREGDGVCIALPFDPQRAFPLPALFCLACIERVEGRVHAVYRFDCQGRPVLGYKEGADGQE